MCSHVLGQHQVAWYTAFVPKCLRKPRTTHQYIGMSGQCYFSEWARTWRHITVIMPTYFLSKDWLHQMFSNILCVLGWFCVSETLASMRGALSSAGVCHQEWRWRTIEEGSIRDSNLKAHRVRRGQALWQTYSCWNFTGENSQLLLYKKLQQQQCMMELGIHMFAGGNELKTYPWELLLPQMVEMKIPKKNCRPLSHLKLVVIWGLST